MKGIKSKPRTPRKLKVTNVFGGGDRKYIPPVLIKKSERPKSTTVIQFPPLPDDSRAQLTTVEDSKGSILTDRNDLRNVSSLPLSITEKSEKENNIPSTSSSNLIYSPTPIHLLKTESFTSTSLPPSISHSPTPSTSPVAKSPIQSKKGKKMKKEKTSELSPIATSPILPKKKSKKKGEKKESSKHRRKNGRTEQKNTPQERVVFREKEVYSIHMITVV